ncbi:MAG TPA: DMT family transporter [Candidatus Saccharimonadales bacterium]|nr:DMT family transporter [Candidatus Saccharimonadales bacterium]
MTSKQKALFAIIFAAILGGGIAVFVKIALTEIPIFSLSFFRFLIASLCMLPVIIKSFHKAKQHRSKIIGISLLATANTVIFSFGVKLTTATASQILYAIVPLVIALISYFYLKERLQPQKILGIILGFIGIAIIILLPAFAKGANVAGSVSGDLIILIAILCFSFYSVFSKRLHEHYSSSELTSYFLLTSLCAQTILAPIDLHTYPGWWHQVTMTGVFATLYIGTCGMFLWYILYQYAIKHGSPTIASLTFYLQPITTFVWAFFLLGERINGIFIFGAAITFLGLWITTRTYPEKVLE